MKRVSLFEVLLYLNIIFKRKEKRNHEISNATKDCLSVFEIFFLKMENRQCIYSLPFINIIPALLAKKSIHNIQNLNKEASNKRSLKNC